MERSHTLLVRVYYEDTDFSGRVYHASYLRFMERARTEWLRELGVSHRLLAETSGMAFAVRRLSVEFVAPAMIDDLLRVETRVAELRGASLIFLQTVCRGDNRLIEGRIEIAAVSGGRPRRIPAEIRRLLEGGR